MAQRIRPSHDMLTRFLRERQPRSAEEVGELVGWPAGRATREAAARSALTAQGLVRWDAAAEWLLDAWPLAAILDVLGSDSSLLPAGLHPVPLVLRPPAYLAAALRVQARLERLPHRVEPPADFNEYMTDLLHRAIEPETVEALRADEELLRAYHFPGEPPNEADDE